jgi:hypothetical protein
MSYRDNKMQKLITRTTRDVRVKRDQTFSAPKGSVSKYGGPRSATPVDEPRGAISTACASRSRKMPKITLAAMPWDAKP